MKKNDKQTDDSRRKFLQGTLASGAGVVLTAAAPGMAVASTADIPAETEKKEKGYRLTQHIVDYYKTAAS